MSKLALKAAIRSFQLPPGTEIRKQFTDLDAALRPLSNNEVLEVVDEVVGEDERIVIRDALTSQNPLLRDFILDRKHTLFPKA